MDLVLKAWTELLGLRRVSPSEICSFVVQICGVGVDEFLGSICLRRLRLRVGIALL